MCAGDKKLKLLEQLFPKISQKPAAQFHGALGYPCSCGSPFGTSQLSCRGQDGAGQSPVLPLRVRGRGAKPGCPSDKLQFIFICRGWLGRALLHVVLN